eukprot:m.106040 g.106040  ORF g.106040 m.106040 type:complete len:174 (-) comp51669_c0_seq16:113-634(-)
MWWRQHLACTPQCHRLVENLEAARTRHKVDVTIRNPHASHLITTASKQQLHAANEGVKEKKQKYSAYIAEGERFFPLAMETFGGIHDQIREFVGLASWRVNNVAYDSNTWLRSAPERCEVNMAIMTTWNQQVPWQLTLQMQTISTHMNSSRSSKKKKKKRACSSSFELSRIAF